MTTLTAPAPAANGVAPKTSPRRPFIAVPSYNGWVRQEAYDGLHRASLTAERWCNHPGKGSLLAYVFNQLLYGCYNSRKDHGWTHWLLHHADVEAPPGWADALMDEADRVGADVLSAVVAIKDGRGVTSTGVADPATGAIRRLTQHEVSRLPVTFDVADVRRELGVPEGAGLAVNTGLMLLRCETVFPFLRPGARGEKDPGLFFSVLDGARENADGTLTACVLPEDWHFSRACRERGLRVFATRKLTVRHHGEAVYPAGGDCPPWGDWKTDEGDTPDPAEAVEGWMSRGELQWLRRAAAKASVVVEVGCWKGRGTRALAESCPGTVYAVDHFRGSPDDGGESDRLAACDPAEARAAFERNLADHLKSRKVVLWEMPSADAARWFPVRHTRPAVVNQPADLVFLDGGHDYESVRADIEAWRPLIRPAGVLAGHDRDRPGVRKAIDELLPGLWKAGPGSIWEATL